MIDKTVIFQIHRLKNQGLSQRDIAKELGIGRATVKKYSENPVQIFSMNVQRGSKPDPFREQIDDFLEQEPEVKAPVVLQRLREMGFDGKITIVRDYLRKRRGRLKNRRAFIRFESSPGQQVQVDWGHFGNLVYGKTKRKLYALALTECYSRMLYVEFTHSQKQESLHQCFVKAFQFFGGTPKEIVVDNMLTAVIERQGKMIRFNENFLDFLRPFHIVPVACNVRAPHEKGKVERTIGYIKQNFRPLRSFTDLPDVRNQVMHRLNTISNVRIHQTTGERPCDRFAQVRLTSLPEFLPDYRETCTARVHKDFAIRFDGNTYTVPPWCVGRQVTVKAGRNILTVYDRQKKLTVHHRCRERKQRIELPEHVEQVKTVQKKLWTDQKITLFVSPGQPAREYLRSMTDAGLPIKKNVEKIWTLKEQYGAESILQAMTKAAEHNAWGAEYIENILYQEMTPNTLHPPVKLKDENLNRICLAEPALAEYDAYVLKRIKEND